MRLESNQGDVKNTADDSAGRTSQRPILVTGAHRSGSTWVGTMLALPPEVGFIMEPFHLLRRPGLRAVPMPYWYFYVTDENEAAYLPALRDTLAFRYNVGAELRALRRPKDVARMVRDMVQVGAQRARQLRPLVKDPIALFSAPWLARRFQMDVVVIIRHPAAFVGSLKKAGWTHDFNGFVAQPLLMRDLLAPFEAEIRAYAAQPPDIVDQGILLWKLIHHTIHWFQTQHPTWHFVRHEDLSRQPVEAFRILYKALALDFTPAIEQTVASYTQAATASRLKRDSVANVWSWKKRLTPAEIDHIRAQTEPLAAHFYSDDDW